MTDTAPSADDIARFNAAVQQYADLTGKTLEVAGDEPRRDRRRDRRRRLTHPS